MCGSVALAALLLGGCPGPRENDSEREPPRSGAPAPPEPGQRVAGTGPIPQLHSPWRNSGDWHELHVHLHPAMPNLWNWASERFRLAELIGTLPVGMERVQAQLRLARLGPNRSLWARLQVLRAQDDLTTLFTQSPTSPGILEAAVDANRTFAPYDIDSRTKFYERARVFLATRWKLGQADAAEAGYRLSQIMATTHRSDELERENLARQRLLEEIIERFPGSDWAVAAEYELVGLRWTLSSRRATATGDDRYLRQYVEFADRHAGHPMAAKALLHAAQSYGFGEYGRAQHGGQPNIPRLERAMQLHVRYEREYPRATRRSRLFPSVQPQPSVHVWGDATAESATDHLERLAQQYYALNPRGATSLVTTLAKLKDELTVAEYSAFYRRFWDGVERLAKPAMLPEVRLARAFFISDAEPYSTVEQRRSQHHEASDILKQVEDEWPESEAAAVALDARALIALRLERPQQALDCWQRLAERYPDHPVNRPAAVDSLFLQHETHAGPRWRAALEDLQQRFPDDPLVALITSCLQAQSWQHQGDIRKARGEYQGSLSFWRSVFPLVQLQLTSRNVALGPLHEIQADRLEKAGLIEMNRVDDRGNLARPPSEPFEEPLAAYRRLVDSFPDSPHLSEHLYALATAEVAAGRLEEARESFQRLEELELTDPLTHLTVRIYATRLDFALSQDPSVTLYTRRLASAIEQFSQAVRVRESVTARERDVDSLYRHLYEEHRAGELQQALRPLVDANGLTRWYLFTGSESIEAEFYDGLLMRYQLTPQLPVLVREQALHLPDPALLLASLGVGDAGSKEFVDKVVSRVFVMNTMNNRQLLSLDHLRQGMAAPGERGAEHLAAAPLIIELPPLLRQVLFYDARRNRAEARGVITRDLRHDLFHQRVDDAWTPSDGNGWFRWD